MTAGFDAGAADSVVLAVEADDEYGAAVHVAARLAGNEYGRFAPFWSYVSHALAKAAAAELLRTAKELNRVIGAEGGDAWRVARRCALS